MIRHFSLCLMLVFATMVSGQDKAPEPEPLKIKLLPGDWGDGSSKDFQRIVDDTATHLWPYFPGHKIDPIEVAYGKDGPITYYGRSPEGAIRVRLNVQGAHWAQLAFQFAHELGHVLCNYQKGENANQWFEETLCEVASLYALRRMTVTWKTAPPFERARSFAPSLQDYAQERINAAKLPEGVALPEWFEANRNRLRNPYLRQLNNIVALQLLPLFEDEPKHWAAIIQLNDAKHGAEQSFEDYLGDWHHHVPAEHKPFVAKVAECFGLTLPDRAN